MRPDYCPIGNEPCQSLCDTPCSTKQKYTTDAMKVRQAVAQALAQSEPVAWRYDQAKYRTNDLRGRQWAFNVFSQAKPYIDEMVQNVTPLYITPPQRKPLTDEEIRNLWDGHVIPIFGKNGINPIVFARAIEAAHGIKVEA
jgi:hypothetical protein